MGWLLAAGLPVLLVTQSEGLGYIVAAGSAAYLLFDLLPRGR